jgi:hypothetical protein
VARVCHAPAAETAVSTRNLARDRVTSADPGKHFQKRVENTIYRSPYSLKALIVDIIAKQLTLGSRMFAVRLDVNTEIGIMLRIVEAIMFLESVDLGFADCRNLTFISIKRGEAFGYRSIPAERSECFRSNFSSPATLLNSAHRYR